MTYRDLSRDELRDELQDRDLPVAGTKDELIERLEADDDGREDEATHRVRADSNGNPGAFEPIPGPTRDEIRDELQERGLSVAGTKEELLERLEEAKAGEDAGRDASAGGGDGDTDGDLGATEIAGLAVHQLTQLVAGEIQGVASLERGDGGWQVSVEVVELPAETVADDVLGLYELALSERGALHRYERVRRYVRHETDS